MSYEPGLFATFREKIRKATPRSVGIVKRSDQARGFEGLPKRWIVERTLAWLTVNRRPDPDLAARDQRVGTYTLALTLAQPGLWLELFGPLVKNLPILVAVLVLAALEDDR